MSFWHCPRAFTKQWNSDNILNISRIHPHGSAGTVSNHLRITKSYLLDSFGQICSCQEQFRMILSCLLPCQDKYRKWICFCISPSVRKTGLPVEAMWVNHVVGKRWGHLQPCYKTKSRCFLLSFMAQENLAWNHQIKHTEKLHCLQFFCFWKMRKCPFICSSDCFLSSGGTFIILGKNTAPRCILLSSHFSLWSGQKPMRRASIDFPE